MNIILGDIAAQQARERYVVLELDRFRVPGQPQDITAYCVIEHIALDELSQVPDLTQQHQNLIDSYRVQDWDRCDQCLDQLRGRWQGVLDSFYDSVAQRIGQQRDNPSESWDPVVIRTPAQ